MFCLPVYTPCVCSAWGGQKKLDPRALFSMLWATTWVLGIEPTRTVEEQPGLLAAAPCVELLNHWWLDVNRPANYDSCIHYLCTRLFLPTERLQFLTIFLWKTKLALSNTPNLKNSAGYNVFKAPPFCPPYLPSLLPEITGTVCGSIPKLCMHMHVLPKKRLTILLK